MDEPSFKRKRARRNEHVSRFFLETNHRHPFPRAEIDQLTTATTTTTESLASSTDTRDVRQASSTSFDVLSVEPRTTSTWSERGQRTSSHTHRSEPIAYASSLVVSTLSQSTSASVETVSISLEKPLELQVEQTTTIQRTTLILSATFALPSSSPVLSSLSASSALIGPLSTMRQSETWSRSIPNATYTHSASATASSVAHAHPSHPHISPVLMVFMVIAGFATLALSIYVFRRARYKALHVSRSQFQLASSSEHDGSAGVAGSESNKSFVSGGLGLLSQSHKQKNGYLDASGESPLWGGREKFSPQVGDVILDFPPPAHMHTNERLPGNSRRLSVIDTIRRKAPGRLSKYGAGWNTIPEAAVVPTFKITDTDTNHHRGASGSTFCESPDPNLASIQIASVTRPFSATASYASSPLPGMRPSLEHPRPAPKVPPKSPARQYALGIQVPGSISPVPGLPDISGSTTGQKKLMDVNSRGKIDVADISKPLPAAMLPKAEMTIEGNRAAGEADPMAMYAKYSVGLGVRNEFPEMVRRETSMAQKIAQIANSSSSSSRPTLAPTGSQSSLTKRDTRALAAAAGLAGPTASEKRALPGVDKKQALGSASLPDLPGTPGLASVGNVMLRSYGQSGSMIPAYLETPAIALDGRASYLSTNMGSEVEWRNRPGSSTGPQDVISGAKAIGQNEIATLARSATDDSDRKTIMSQYSQDFVPMSQQGHMHQNPDYRSPTYSIYNYYGSNRVSRMPSMVHIERREPEVGGAL